MEEFFREWSYLAVALYLWGTGFGLPFPEDVCLLLAGWVCAEGYASLWIMLPVCILCVFGSDCVIYVIGRRYGHHVPKWPLINKMLTPEKLKKAEALFHKHGGKTLFAARFLPFVRASTFFVGGTFKYPFWKFCLFDGGAAVLSVPVFVMLGWFFADQMDNLKIWMKEGRNVAILVTIVVIIIFVVWTMWRKKKLAKLAAIEESDVTVDANDASLKSTANEPADSSVSSNQPS